MEISEAIYIAMNTYSTGEDIQEAILDVFLSEEKEWN